MEYRIVKRIELVSVLVIALLLSLVLASFFMKGETITAHKKITAQSVSQFNCSTDKYKRTINKNGINRIHYMAVGGGDATLIESEGHFGLIDSTNPRENDGTAQAIITYKKATVEHVINYLKKVIGCSGSSCKGKLEFIVGTHSHSDHIGGMVEIADIFANENTTYYYRDYVLTTNDFFENGYYNSSNKDKSYDEANDWDNLGYYKRTIEAMNSNGVCLEEVTNKYVDFDFKNFNIKILNTDEANDDESTCIKNGTSIAYSGTLSKWACEEKGGKLYATGENKNSLIQLVTLGKSKNLLAGDMEKEDELRLVKNSNTNQLLSNLDVVKLAHHGGASSTRIEIVKVMRPKYAINSRVNFYAPTMALLQQKYMFDNYNTKLLLTEKADDAIVQTFDKYGNYNMSVDNGKNIDTVAFSLAPAATSGKWYRFDLGESKNWFYFDDNEKIKTTGWLAYNNKWYYINFNGYAVTGWQYLPYNGKYSWYFFNDDCAMQTGWLKRGTNWYYLSSSGAMVTGWQKIRYKNSDSWFYFDDSGVMVTGWQKIYYKEKNSWFYFDDSGVMLSGWQYIPYNGVYNWYYFDSFGVMQTGWLKHNNDWYYLSGSGAMVTGWQKIYYNGKNSWFYFWPLNTQNHKDGSMVTGWQYIPYNGVYNWYYFDSLGVMQTGFITDNGKTYYLSGSGEMVHDKCMTINNKYYCFNSSGARTN